MTYTPINKCARRRVCIYNQDYIGWKISNSVERRSFFYLTRFIYVKTIMKISVQYSTF